MLVSCMTEQDYRERETTAIPLNKSDYALVLESLHDLDVKSLIEQKFGGLGENLHDFPSDAQLIPDLLDEIINPINNYIYKAKGWIDDFGRISNVEFFTQPPHLVRGLLSQNNSDQILRYFQEATIPQGSEKFQIVPKQLSFLNEGHLRSAVHNARDFGFFMLWEKFDAILRYESSAGNLARFRHLRANYDIEEKNMREALVHDFAHRIYAILGRDADDMWRHYFVFVEPDDKAEFLRICEELQDTSLLQTRCALLGSYDAIMYRRERRRSMDNQIFAMVRRYSDFVSVKEARERLLLNRHVKISRRNPYGYKLKTSDWSELSKKEHSVEKLTEFDRAEDITEHYAKLRGAIEPLTPTDPETLIADLLSLRVSLLRASKNSYKGNINAFGQPFVVDKYFARILFALGKVHEFGVREYSHVFRNAVDRAYLWRLDSIADFLARLTNSFQDPNVGWSKFNDLVSGSSLNGWESTKFSFNNLVEDSQERKQFGNWDEDDWYAAYIGTLTIKFLLELRGSDQPQSDLKVLQFNKSSFLNWLHVLRLHAEGHVKKRDGKSELRDFLIDPCIRHPSKIRQCIFALRHSIHTKKQLDDPEGEIKRAIISFSVNNGVKKISVLSSLYRYFIDEENYSQNLNDLEELLRHSLWPAFKECATPEKIQSELIDELARRLLGPDPHKSSSDQNYWSERVKADRTQTITLLKRMDNLPTVAPAIWRDRPNKSHDYTVIDFLKEHYGEQNLDVLRADGTGLRRQDLLKLDKSLYYAIANWLRTNDEMPADCPLPSQSEALESERKFSGIENVSALRGVYDKGK